jgi:hypothetical protein
LEGAIAVLPEGVAWGTGRGTTVYVLLSGENFMFRRRHPEHLRSGHPGQKGFGDRGIRGSVAAVWRPDRRAESPGWFVQQ